MVFPIPKIALVGMGIRSEHSLSVKFTVEELALELVAIVEFDPSMSILEVIMELSFELVIGKASLIHFLAIAGDVLSRYKLVLLENSSVDCTILLVFTYAASSIVLPSSFIKTALRPLHATLSVSHSIFGLADVYLSCSIFYANFVVRQGCDGGSCRPGILFGIGDGDIDG
jgi:hypothetical protein